MPYSVSKSNKCGPSKPWAVVKDATGEVMGCHASKKHANAQLAALHISEGQRSTHMKWERRQVATEVRPNLEGPQQDGLPRQFWARVLNYNVVDDYGTKFAPGCFSESLSRRLPRLMYGHSGWENPSSLLGRGIDYREQRDGLDILFEFDDFTYVPMARQIAYQMSNDPTHPTLDQFSVGFVRERDSRDPSDGKTAITKGRLGETSVVVEGSVPGTKLLSFRSAVTGAPFVEGSMIDANDAARILARFSLGEIDLAQALADVKNIAEAANAPDDDDDEYFTEDEDDESGDEVTSSDAPTEDTPAEEEEEDTPAEDDTEVDALIAEMDVLFDDVELLARHAHIEKR